MAPRTDGWKQGWIVPAGEAGVVHFDYGPEATFGSHWASARRGCCSACWSRCCRRAAAPLREAASRAACRPRGLLDVVVALAAGGLLVGWWGLAAVAVALVAGVAVRRFEGWAALAAAAMLMVGAGLSWDRITRRRGRTSGAGLVPGGRRRLVAAVATWPGTDVPGRPTTRGRVRARSPEIGSGSSRSRGSIRAKNRMFLARRIGRSKR